MRVVFMGTPDFSVAPLKALLEGGHEILAAVTQPDKPRGRGKNMQMTPVKEEALKKGISVYQPVKVRDPEFVRVIKELAPDVIVVVAFGQIIPQSILDVPPYGCINIHASLLPKYRGSRPHPVGGDRRTEGVGGYHDADGRGPGYRGYFRAGEDFAGGGRDGGQPF